MTTQAAPHVGNGTAPHLGPRLRASDVERSAVVEVLQDAIARGLLTHDEGGERMAAALAAKYRDELPELTADLPPAPPSPTPAPPTAPGWRRLGTTFTTQVRSDLRAAVAAGPRSRRFLATAFVIVLLLAFLLTVFGLAMHGLADSGGYDDDWGHHWH